MPLLLRPSAGTAEMYSPYRSAERSCNVLTRISLPIHLLEVSNPAGFEALAGPNILDEQDIVKVWPPTHLLIHPGHAHLLLTASPTLILGHFCNYYSAIQ